MPAKAKAKVAAKAKAKAAAAPANLLGGDNGDVDMEDVNNAVVPPPAAVAVAPPPAVVAAHPVDDVPLMHHLGFAANEEVSNRTLVYLITKSRTSMSRESCRDKIAALAAQSDLAVEQWFVAQEKHKNPIVGQPITHLHHGIKFAAAAREKPGLQTFPHECPLVLGGCHILPLPGKGWTRLVKYCSEENAHKTIDQLDVEPISNCPDLFEMTATKRLSNTDIRIFLQKNPDLRNADDFVQRAHALSTSNTATFTEKRILVWIDNHTHLAGAFAHLRYVADICLGRELNPAPDMNNLLQRFLAHRALPCRCPPDFSFKVGLQHILQFHATHERGDTPTVSEFCDRVVTWVRGDFGKAHLILLVLAIFSFNLKI